MDEKPDNAEPPAKPRRRWYQYSLRTLLIFVTLAGCGFGWLGAKIQEARQQQVAVEAFRKLGREVHYYDEYDLQGNLVQSSKPPGPGWVRALLGDDFFRSVYSVYVSDASKARPIADADLENLKGFTKLKVLELGSDGNGTGTILAWLRPGSKVTDAGLECISELSELTMLNLSGRPVTDAGLEHFKGLTQLEDLQLDDTYVTDAALEKLKGLTRLERLCLDGTQVTDAGLEQVKQLTNLKQLFLSNTQVTNAGLGHLKGLPQLNSLSLGGTRVTNAGLEHLKHLTQLEWLNLENTRVTDTGLEHLKGLAKLAGLMLNGTDVTDAGEAKLHKALPKCYIVRPPDSDGIGFHS